MNDISVKLFNFTRIKALWFTNPQKQAFLEDLSTLLADGVMTNHAIQYISSCSQGVVKEVAESIAASLAEGKSIADGLQGWFPHYICELIRAGEEGGSFPQTLKAAAEALSQKNDTIQVLIHAITYPLVVLLMGLGITIFIKYTVLNQFLNLMPLTNWPPIGKSMMYLAGIIQYWGWIFVIFPVVFGLILFKFMQLYHGELRASLDYLPGFNLYRKISGAHLLQLIGLLIANGISIKKAIKILQPSATPYLSNHLLAMEYRLGAGRDNIADVLDTGLLDTDILQRLKITAHGKGFEHALIKQGEFAQKQLNRKMQRIAKLTGNVLLGIAGGLAVFLVFGLYTTGFALVGQ